MSENVIVVENLSKSYLIGHQYAGRATVREVIERELSNFARKTADIIHGRQVIQGDEVEEFWALKDVSFEVKQGEVLGIVGRNGAGKSTLLKILSRITEPSEGRILLKGRVASLLEVGTGFHPELTGRENIYLNGAILGMTYREIRKKFDEIVAFAEVEKFLDTPVKHFSSGMFVRLAFAVAAHLEPEVLIVDEVLAVGDVEFQRKCLGKMEGVTSEGRTALFVSHQIAAVNQLCRRVLWLDKGKVVESGDTSTVLPRYLSVGTSNVPIVELKKPKRDDTVLFFSRVAILDKDRNPTAELDARFPFNICLHYEVKKPVKGVEMTAGIKTAEGAAVFTSIYSDCSDVTKMDKSPGSYVTTIEIPGHFLMPGTYTLCVHAFRFVGHKQPLDILDHVIRFSISETGTKVAKYNDYKDQIGVVLVNFPWHDQPAYQNVSSKAEKIVAT